MSMIKVRDNNWLSEIGADSTGWYIVLHDLNGLKLEDAIAAVEAQYGKGRFYIRHHGTDFVAHDIPKYEKASGRKHS